MFVVMLCRLLGRPSYRNTNNNDNRLHHHYQSNNENSDSSDCWSDSTGSDSIKKSDEQNEACRNKVDRVVQLCSQKCDVSLLLENADEMNVEEVQTVVVNANPTILKETMKIDTSLLQNDIINNNNANNNDNNNYMSSDILSVQTHSPISYLTTSPSPSHISQLSYSPSHSSPEDVITGDERLSSSYYATPIGSFHESLDNAILFDNSDNGSDKDNDHMSSDEGEEGDDESYSPSVYASNESFTSSESDTATTPSEGDDDDIDVECEHILSSNSHPSVSGVEYFVDVDDGVCYQQQREHSVGDAENDEEYSNNLLRVYDLNNGSGVMGYEDDINVEVGNENYCGDERLMHPKQRLDDVIHDVTVELSPEQMCLERVFECSYHSAVHLNVVHNTSTSSHYRHE
ncbi:unnamed protein product [Anisakis simplex]|uniref:Serine/threonine-protein kinase DDB_G0282963 n=1 Tax=Anisakis simplex TaxID=6269 RepID=A0A0M3JYL2_ANISI|nr:unnamed protein product [Anisakis simplex]